MSWDNTHPLRVGDSVNTVATVDEEGVQLKNVGNKTSEAEETSKERDEPAIEVNKSSMIFVNQHIAYTPKGQRAPSLVERRSHVFLPGAAPRGGAPKPGACVHLQVYCSAP